MSAKCQERSFASERIDVVQDGDLAQQDLADEVTPLWRSYVAAHAFGRWGVTLFAPATDGKAEHV
jgi:hypothetical protein